MSATAVRSGPPSGDRPVSWNLPPGHLPYVPSLSAGQDSSTADTTHFCCLLSLFHGSQLKLQSGGGDAGPGARAPGAGAVPRPQVPGRRGVLLHAPHPKEDSVPRVETALVRIVSGPSDAPYAFVLALRHLLCCSQLFCSRCEL